MGATAARCKEGNFRIEHGKPLGAQGSVQSGGSARGNHAPIPQGQDIAAKAHGITIGHIKAANAMGTEPGDQLSVQYIKAGNRKAGCGHTKQHIQMQEMFIKAFDADFPTLGPQLEGELFGPRKISTPARSANQRKAGADDVDIATFERTG